MIWSRSERKAKKCLDDEGTGLKGGISPDHFQNSCSALMPVYFLHRFPSVLHIGI